MGETGNANAVANAISIKNRNVCSNSFLNPSSPLYHERFARNPDISVSTSAQIFNEIKTNNLFKTNNYFNGFTSKLWSSVAASPQSFPTTNALIAQQKAVVDEQLSCTVADH